MPHCPRSIVSLEIGECNISACIGASSRNTFVTSLRNEALVTLETGARDVAVVSLSNKVNNFKIRSPVDGISVQVSSCKYKPTIITNHK
jgi:hypothetical protein